MSFRQGRQERYAAKRQRQNDSLALAEAVSNGNPSSVALPATDSRITKIQEAYPSHIHVVSLDDVYRIKRGVGGTSPTVVDELLRPYLDLRDGATTSNGTGTTTATASTEQLFIAEGTETVRLLLQQLATSMRSEGKGELDAGSREETPAADTASATFSTSGCGSLVRNLRPPIVIQSLLIKPQLLLDPPVQLWDTVQRLFDKNTDSISQSTAGMDSASAMSRPFFILVATEDVLCAATGMASSRGCLACGVVPNTPRRDESWLYSFLQSALIELPSPPQAEPGNRSSCRILALDGISDTANLGSMIRTAAALGVHVIILGRDCCDAWYRRSVRVSMGHVFHIPIVRLVDEELSETIVSTLRNKFQVTSYAAVIDPGARYRLSQLKQGDVPNCWCCVMGSEAHGISDKVVQACDGTLRIDMEEGVDSLSVPIAAGILLNGLRERECGNEYKMK